MRRPAAKPVTARWGFKRMATAVAISADQEQALEMGLSIGN